MSNNNNEEKKPIDKINSIAIYAYAMGLFLFVVLSSQSSLEIKFDWPQITGFSLVLVLLLFRYFDFIKLGGFMELRKKFEKTETFMESTKNDLSDLEREVFKEMPITKQLAPDTESQLQDEQHDKENTDEQATAKSETNTQNKTRMVESFASESSTKPDISAKPDTPTDIQIQICLDMLNDRKWKYRTAKTLMRRSKMTDKQFEQFLNDHPNVVKSRIDDILGNDLYKIKK